jgi:hypothetical protein
MIVTFLAYDWLSIEGTKRSCVPQSGRMLSCPPCFQPPSRTVCTPRPKEPTRNSTSVVDNDGVAWVPPRKGNENQTVLDEVKDIIHLPNFRATRGSSQPPARDPNVERELKDYVSAMAIMYRNNPIPQF